MEERSTLFTINTSNSPTSTNKGPTMKRLSNGQSCGLNDPDFSYFITNAQFVEKSKTTFSPYRSFS